MTQRQTGTDVLVELTADTFADTVRDGWTFVDFWAEWCGPCRALAPVYEEVAQQYAGRARFAKLDTDTAHEIAERYGVRTIPTVILFDPDGEEVGRVVNPGGAFPDMVEEIAAEKGF